MNDKHRHKWRMVPCTWNMSIEAMCINKDCSVELDQGEIEKRLNATECLDRTQTLLLAGVLKTEFGDRASLFREYLLSYSKALEDK